MNIDDLKLVAMIVNEPGIKLIEGEIKKQIIGNDTVERVTSDVFQNGWLKGYVEGKKSDIQMIQTLRQEANKIKED